MRLKIHLAMLGIAAVITVNKIEKRERREGRGRSSGEEVRERTGGRRGEAASFAPFCPLLLIPHL